MIARHRRLAPLNPLPTMEERAIVLDKDLEALKVESFYRFPKIIKTPGPGNAHEEMLAELQDIRFFSQADGYESPRAQPNSLP